MGNTFRNSANAPGLPTAPRSTAWLVSMIIHLSLLLLAVVLVRHHAAGGMADEPSREVGIVLMHQGPDGPRFQGEESVRRRCGRTCQSDRDRRRDGARPIGLVRGRLAQHGGTSEHPTLSAPTRLATGGRRA